MTSAEHTLLNLETADASHPLGSIPLAIANKADYEREFKDEQSLFVIIGKDAIVAATIDHLSGYLRTRNSVLGVRALSMMQMLEDHGVRASGFENLLTEVVASLVKEPAPPLEVYCEALSHPEMRAQVSTYMADLALRRYASYAGEPLDRQETAALAAYDQAFSSLFEPITGFSTREELVRSQAAKYPGLGLV